MSQDRKEIFEQLRAPFPVDNVRWRIGHKTKDKKKAMVLAYVDARDVQNRLDDVVGPDNWEVLYAEQPSGLLVSTLRIRFRSKEKNVDIAEDGTKETTFHWEDEWVAKSDGAGETAVEAEKGKVSDAFKRSAVVWGVGRYLYDLGTNWVNLKNEYGDFDPPKLPAWAIPKVNTPKKEEAGSAEQPLFALVSQIKGDFGDLGKERLIAWAGYFNIPTSPTGYISLDEIPEQVRIPSEEALAKLYKELQNSGTH